MIFIIIFYLRYVISWTLFTATEQKHLYKTMFQGKATLAKASHVDSKAMSMQAGTHDNMVIKSGHGNGNKKQSQVIASAIQ